MFSNEPRKKAPKRPPIIPITNQGSLALDSFQIESSSSTSDVIPDIICLSSSAVSVITSKTSSIVILPSNLPLLLITGRTVRSYFCIIWATSSWFIFASTETTKSSKTSLILELSFARIISFSETFPNSFPLSSVT